MGLRQRPAGHPPVCHLPRRLQPGFLNLLAKYQILRRKAPLAPQLGVHRLPLRIAHHRRPPAPHAMRHREPQGFEVDPVRQAQLTIRGGLDQIRWRPGRTTHRLQPLHLCPRLLQRLGNDLWIPNVRARPRHPGLEFSALPDPVGFRGPAPLQPGLPVGHFHPRSFLESLQVQGRPRIPSSNEIRGAVTAHLSGIQRRAPGPVNAMRAVDFAHRE